MAAPTRKPTGLPLDCFLHAEPFDEAELDRLAAQGQRNREFLASRWEELLREHRGEWVIVYGDRQMVVGNDYTAMRNSIEIDDLRAGLSKFIQEEPLFTRLW